MNFCKDWLTLYAITPADLFLRDDPLGRVEAALKNGVTLLQLREKNISDEEFIRRGRLVRELCDRCGVPLIINDNPGVALAVGAAGLHLGQRDGGYAAARRLLGKDAVIGGSLRSLEDARRADLLGVDYLGVGAVFPTTTKADAVCIGSGLLREICAATALPVVAIGGIDLKNIALLRGSGVCGVAVVSGIFGAGDPGAAAAAFRKEADLLSGAVRG